MPLFYFDIQIGENVTKDHVGLMLPNIDAAQKEAAVIAASIARDDPTSINGSIVVIILVRDERGQPVLKFFAQISAEIVASNTMMEPLERSDHREFGSVGRPAYRLN